jgi:hypothetical protein
MKIKAKQSRRTEKKIDSTHFLFRESDIRDPPIRSVPWPYQVRISRAGTKKGQVASIHVEQNKSRQHMFIIQRA